MTDRIKIKYWWSEDKKWFCILTDDGNNQSTVSLTVEEASLLSMNAVREGPSDVAQIPLDREQIAKAIYAGWLDADHCTENHFQWFDAGKNNPESCVHYSNVAKALKVADRILALSSTDRHCEFCHVPMPATDCCESEFEAKGCPHTSPMREGDSRPAVITHMGRAKPEPFCDTESE